MLKPLALSVSGLAVLLVASPALASFHLMKVEQAIGGVAGDLSQQAIQLRMRAPGQNLVGSNQARLKAWDAAGLNPVTLIIFPSDVANAVQGARILVVSPAFAAAQPGIAADFAMTSLIPASYLAAGRLTFEDGGGAADARAVALILTVVRETELGGLRPYPAGAILPTASAINFTANQTKANNAVIPLGASGQIAVRCDMAPGSTGSTHFLFDVSGYFR